MSPRRPNADGTGRTGRTARCVVPLRTLLIRWRARTVGRSRSQLLAVALGSLTVAGCNGAHGDAADGDPLAAASTTGSSTTAATANAPADSAPAVALPVVTEGATDGALILRVSTRSEAVVPLKAEVAGTVLQLLVRLGQSVAAGRPLVKFDPYPFALATREAQAGAAEAEQRFLES